MSPVANPIAKAPFKLPEVNIDWLSVKETVLSIVASKNFRTAAMVFSVFFALSLFARSLKSSGGEVSKTKQALTRSLASVRASVTSVKQFANGRWLRLREKFRKKTEQVGIPMPFDYRNDNEGWGVCTLRAKRRLGRSSFVQYEFDLPEPDYVLPLDLGQQISLCCLDNYNNVAKGEFFPYIPDSKTRLGTFSILAPNRTPTENEFAIGDDAANFVSVLRANYLGFAFSVTGSDDIFSVWHSCNIGAGTSTLNIFRIDCIGPCSETRLKSRG